MTAPVERTWEGFTRRLGLRTQTAIRGLWQGLIPVVVAATPDFADQERSLFVGGNDVAAVGGEFGAFGLVCEVETMIFAVVPISPSGSTTFYAVSDDVTTFDPFQNARTEQAPSLRPFDRASRNRVVAGRSPTQYGTKTGAIPSQLPSLVGGDSPLIVPAGKTIAAQSSVGSVYVRGTFVWRELEP